jgi:hypothetical protein
MVGIFLNTLARLPFRSTLHGALVLLTLSAMALPALATTSRINSLGGNGDFFEDDANVLRWFGSLVDYPDQVVLESGNFNIPDGYWEFPSQKRSGPGLGAHYALGSEGRLGTAAIFYHDHDNRSTTLHPSGLRNNLSLIYALDLGPLTGSLAYRYGTWEVGQSGETDNHSADTFGAGLRMDMGESAYLDLAGEYRSTSHQGPDLSTSDSSNSESIYSLRGRAFIALGERTAFIPLFEFFNEDRMHPQDTPSHPTRLDHQMFRFGFGLNYFPDTDHLLLFNIEYVDGQRKYMTIRPELQGTWTALNMRAGFESRMLSWLTTRGSLGFVDFASNTDWVDFQDPSDLMNLDGPILRVNLGFAFHLGPADLDFSFGERYPEARFEGRPFEPRKHWLSATARYLF